MIVASSPENPTSSSRVPSDKGFTASMAPCGREPGGTCPNGKRRRLKEIGGRSPASPRRCRRSFRQPFYLGRSPGRSYRLRRGSRSMVIGARIRYAQIAWRARLPPAAERPPGGPGGSPITAKTVGNDIPNTAGAISRTRIRPWPRILLHMRTTGLSLRVACGSLGLRRQQECELAQRLRGRVGILECAERPSQAPAASAGAPLWADRSAAVAER